MNGNVSFVFGEADTRIHLGKNCLLADNVSFWTSDSHAIYPLHGSQRINPPGDIHVYDRVWIGEGVRFLNHSSVAQGSVVATRSLVTKKFSLPNVLLGGIPTDILRKDICWEIKIE